MFDKLKTTSHTDRAMDTKAAEPPLSAPVAAVSQTAGKAAVIGAGIRINGEISGNENLLIEGQVDGRISLAGNDVTIGRTGQVIADVSAKTIRVAGEVNGDLKAKERVVISGTGNVRGNVIAPRVVLEDGAIFKGSIDMDPGDSAVKDQAASRISGKANGASAGAAAGSGQAANNPEPASKTPADKAPDLALKGG